MKSMPLTLLLAALAATAAFAHTDLAESVPADQAVLETAPEQITLKFSAPVRLTALSVQLDGGKKQSLGPLPTEASTDFAVEAPALAEGHYTVAWRALSEDTHVMTGDFMFAIGAEAGHDAHAPPAAAGADGEGAPAGHDGH